MNAPTAGGISSRQFGIFLGLVIGALFPDVLLGTSSFFYRDFGVWAYPNAFFHRDTFWKGEVPLWNPYNNCGIPFLAQWNTLTLYPPSLIYLLLPLPWSLNLFCLAHLWLAGMGMFLLARRWTGDGLSAAVAGTGYALNGLTLHSLMWPQIIAALGWLPLVVLSGQRAGREGGRWMAFATVVGAIQMMTGGVEIILLTWVALFVTCLADQMSGGTSIFRAFRRVGWVVVGVTLLSAAQLLPFFELAAHSQRTTGFGDSTWSVPAFGWANFLVPLFHQTRSIVGVYSYDGQQWTSSYYAGIAVVLLAAIGAFRIRDRRVWTLSALCVFAFLMSMGDNSLLYRTVKAVIPQMGYFRFPVKFIVLVVFSLPLLAAFGILAFHKAEAQRPTTRTLQIVLAVFVMAMTGIVWTSYLHPIPGESWRMTLVSGISRGAFLAGAGLALWKLSLGGSLPARRVVQWAIPLLIALDAATHAPRQNPAIAAGLMRPGMSELLAMPRLGSGRAMVTRTVREFMNHAATPNLPQYYLGQRATLFENCNLIDRVPTTTGFFPLYVRAGAEIGALLEQSTNSIPAGLADFLGTAQISSRTNIFGWTARSTALPLITAGQKPIVADTAGTLQGLGGPEFNPLEVVFLPLDAAGSNSPIQRSRAQVEEVRVSTHRIDAVVQGPAPAMVVAAQSHYPSWHGLVNGTEVPLLRANHAFQAVEAAAGRSVVTLICRDRRFQLGLFVSALTLLCCVRAIRRQPRVPRAIS